MTDKIESLITAALYDFGGWLTSREEVITVSATSNAAPMADAISKFLKMRGVFVTGEVPVLTWQDSLLREAAAPSPEKKEREE